MRTLLRGATVVLPGEVARTDLLLDGARIAHVGVPAGARVDETIDLSGLHVFPGVVDDQVHLREPGLTHKEDLTSGTRAAVRGGVTTVFDMPNVVPATTTLDRLEARMARAAEVGRANVAFFIGATPDNVDEIRRVEAAAGDRVPGIKIFIGSSTGDLLVDAQDALEALFARTTLPITAHCEDEATVRANRARVAAEAEAAGRPLTPADHLRIRDHAAAAIATRRAFDLARRHRHRFHLLHVTTAEEVEIVRAAKADPVLGPLVTAEACVPHLWFTDADYERLGTRLLQNPSVKTAADRAALRAGLADGTLDLIATDHAPHTADEKARPYPEAPSGMPSLENSLAVVLTMAQAEGWALPDVARWMAEAPARVWGAVGKGRIAEGFDADLAVVDLSARRVLLDAEQVSKAGWTPWDGAEVAADVVATFVGGRRAYGRDATGRGVFDETVRGRPVTFERQAAPGRNDVASGRAGAGVRP